MMSGLWMRGLESVLNVPQELLMLSQNWPEATYFLNRFHQLVIYNVPSCVCVLLILERVTSLRQGLCCPIRAAAGCKVLPTHLPAPCRTHHLSSYYTLILFVFIFFFSLFVFIPIWCILADRIQIYPLTGSITHAFLTYIWLTEM